MKKSPRILVLRTDRLGDVLMAIPSLFYLREALPDSQLSFGCRDEVAKVLLPTLEERKIRQLSPEKALEAIEGNEFDAVLFLFSEPNFLKRAWWKRVPLRVGLYSKWRSFLLLSDGLRQCRSKSIKSEAIYNLDLARLLVEKIQPKAAETKPPLVLLKGDEPSRLRAKTVLGNFGLSHGDPFVVFHPGMGGSALNVSAETYVKVIDAVKDKKKCPVLLSVGPSSEDQRLSSEIIARRKDLHIIQGESLSVLREVFRLAQLVVAPSTGPIHLAHLAGAETIGIYPPVRSQRKERWAPWGGGAKNTTLSPEVPCPGATQCIGEGCEKFYCMEKWDWVAHLPFLQKQG